MVIAAIREAARQHGVRRVWLFGSRARGEHRPKSDIDLAVSGVDMDEPISQELRETVLREGVVLYEEVR